MVDCTRDQLLAGAGLAGDEDGDVDPGRLAMIWRASNILGCSRDPSRVEFVRRAARAPARAPRPGADKLVDRLLELVETQRLM